MSCPDVAVIVDMDQDGQRRWLYVADVLLTRQALDPPEWMEATFRRYPGAALLAVERPASTRFGLRDGRLVTATPGGAATPAAAFLHGWLAAGRPIEALDGAALRVGGRRGLRRTVHVHIGRWKAGEQPAHVGRLAVGEPLVDSQRGVQVGPRARKVPCR